ncbi:MAG TPA: glycosyltransferase family 4 protein [Solirubrobacteraceae bacterium]|nr:glycosyltransferase family 4 protein [Solirubrobacteraceae bacterium]
MVVVAALSALLLVVAEAVVAIVAGVGGAEVVALLVELCDEPPQAARPKHVMIATSDRRSSLIAPSIDRSLPPSCVAVAIAILTTYLSDYRVPLYRLLARRHDIEVLCYGGGERYAPAWFADLDAQLAAADFPARRLGGLGEAVTLGRRYDAVIAPFAGGALLPAAYAGAHRYGRPFVFWASIWHQPRSAAHAVALPVTRRIFRHSEAVLAYGEHVRRFVASIRGRDSDVFVAPQSVEPELFRRTVDDEEVAAFRAAHGLGQGPLVLYAGRLVPEKGVEVIAQAWPSVSGDATLVVIGDGPLAERIAGLPRTRFLGPLPRPQLPAAYAASAFALLPSIPTPRFKEPWGLVCNEAFEQARPMIATTAVGAAAGGLVRDHETGLVIAPGDPAALARAIYQLLADGALRDRLGTAAHAAVRPYTYEAMANAFDQALEAGGAQAP